MRRSWTFTHGPLSAFVLLSTPQGTPVGWGRGQAWFRWVECGISHEANRVQLEPTAGYVASGVWGKEVWVLMEVEGDEGGCAGGDPENNELEVQSTAAAATLFRGSLISRDLRNSVCWKGEA